ncbi:MAG: FtsX-like permease family protein [Proteobacteria bacterium]|nr:FtsX-like permease family protein [Pseudomonadota bacterium]
MLMRDWRAGELRVLALALLIAVASVTSVSFFADRVRQGLNREAHQLLGGDLLLAGDQPWDPAVMAEIKRRGLAVAQSTNFISMAQSANGAGPKSLLTGAKAVTDSYPLRGKLRIAPRLNAPDAIAGSGPRPGTVWLDERLTSALSANPGDKVKLGDAEFTVAAVLTLEPDRGANFFNIAPRLMMNAADVPATGLIRTGSRVTYQVLVAGERRDVDGFEAWARTRLERGQRIENLDNARPEIRASLDRAQSFLGLTALLAAILAGVAIALATRRFVERHLDGCAVMRCLGATQARLMALYSMEFLMLGVTACAAGCLAGFAAQGLIANWLASIIQAELPQPTAIPALQGGLVGLTLLLGFALPPLLQLRNVPAVRVIRREAGAPRDGALLAYVLGFLTLVLLLLWQSGDLKLGMTVVGGFSAAVLLFIGIAWAALRAASSPASMRFFGAASPAVRYGLANLRRHSRSNAIQVASLALGLTAILLLTITRSDLIDAWRQAAPPDAPNRFLIGIQPEQLKPVQEFFRSAGMALPDVYPMVRGRLTAVNDRPVSEKDYPDERAKRLVEREFNLSYMDRLPAHNQIAAGRWFDPRNRAEGEASVEEGIAKTLGLKLGDLLTYNAAGEVFTARITSLRKLKWDSMKVNFFVVTPTWVLEKAPTSYITAFRLEAGSEPVLDRMVAAFPNLTVVDISAALKQAQGIIDQVILAVQFVFLFALGAGLLVLYSALIATEDERRRESAIMRAFGASAAQVSGSQRAEFLVMGAVAGLLATVAASAISTLLAQRVFQLELPVNYGLWVYGPLAGIALLSLNAWLSARKVLTASPAMTLREG